MNKIITYPKDEVCFSGIEEKSKGDISVFENVEVFHPGTYVDGKTNTKLFYSKDKLEEKAYDWKDNQVNINHSDSPLDRVGEIKDTYFCFDRDAVMGDLHLFNFTTRGKDIIKLIEEGEVNKISPEIHAEKGEYSYEEKANVAEDIKFYGLGLVLYPADKETKIK